ncbi:MAG: beta-galactosidase [Paenibacillaceae bacterium]|jgi:beta-galactosidase|nr:beta-galactosidase [Paenibacillaceae bacterium]
MEGAFHDRFYGRLFQNAGLKLAFAARLPQGVTAQIRTDGTDDYIFLMNFSGEARHMILDGAPCTDMETGEEMEDAVLTLAGYEVRVLVRKHLPPFHIL